MSCHSNSKDNLVEQQEGVKEEERDVNDQSHLLIEVEEEKDEGDSDQEHVSEKHSLLSMDLVMSPECKDWTDWRTSMFRIIENTQLIGRTLKKGECVRVLGMMQQSGFNIYHNVMVDALHQSQIEHRERLVELSNDFLENFMDAIDDKNTERLLMSAKEKGFTGQGQGQGRGGNFGMNDLMKTLYTRDTDQQAWDMMLANMDTHQTRRPITECLSMYIGICLSHRAIISCHFLLMYFRFLMQVLDLLSWDVPFGQHVIQSVVLEKIIGISNEFCRAPFNLEKKIILEISDSISKQQKEPSSSSSSNSSESSSSGSCLIS